jgi:DNA polymerase-3 subunit epsilon
MTILFLDTETTGFVNKDYPAEHEFQPHLVQLGCYMTTDTGGPIATVELIVRPDGWEIPISAAKVHGITTEIALDVGIPLVVAVAVFTNLRARAHELVAHNMSYDDSIMRAAIWRTKRQPASPGPDKRTCTVDLAGPVLQIPPTERMKKVGFTKWKPPNLGECYRFLFEEELVGAHGALTDAKACARVYFELQRRLNPATKERDK